MHMREFCIFPEGVYGDVSSGSYAGRCDDRITAHLHTCMVFREVLRTYPIFLQISQYVMIMCSSKYLNT